MSNEKKWYKTELIDSWAQWEQIMENYDHLEEEWIFRGQRDSSWQLITSLFRDLYCTYPRLNNVIPEELREAYSREIEDEMIAYFFVGAEDHFGFNIKFPSTKDDSHILFRLETLSIMQHYGSPTRLMDFTYNPNVATFFALDGAESDFAVYALNKNLILNSLSEKNKDRFIKFEDSIFNGSEEKFFVTYDPLDYPQSNYVPQGQNQRLDRQDGLFLIPSRIDSTIDEILLYMGIENGMLEGVKVAFQYKFSKNLIIPFWKELFDSGLTHDNLFPDKEGLCKSLKLKKFQSMYQWPIY